MVPLFVPPLPHRQTLRIAVTGHRRNRLNPTECDRIENELEQIFSLIAAHSPGQHEIVSGMADGADLAAVRASPADWQHIGILARSIEEWQRNLARISDADAQTFQEVVAQGNVSTISGATPDYRAVGRQILDGADGLVAIWNGLPGSPGGTGEVVSLAQSRVLPVAIVATR